MVLRRAPGARGFLVFAFHYVGTGATATYGEWVRKIDTSLLCPVQSPGWDNRIVGEPVRTHREFAELLAPPLLPHLDGPYPLTGHCSAIPYLMDRHRLLPRALFASGWRPKQHGPYGRGSTGPLEEVKSTMPLQYGFTLQLDIAAESLMTDLLVQRTHSYQSEPWLPGRTLVIGWDHDTGVPPGLVYDKRWAECGEVKHHVLPRRPLGVPARSAAADRLDRG